MGIKWVKSHRHIMGSWGPWEDVGNGQEMREKHCLDAVCAYVKTRWRKKKKKAKEDNGW